MERIVALFICTFLALGGCGQEPQPQVTRPDEVEPTTFPVTVAVGNRDVEVPARPTRIVSLSATATEILFAIGAGDQVVAVNDQSDYPPGVPTTELSGYEPNVEAILTYEPDLVVANSPDGLGGLAKLNIPLLIQPAVGTLKEAYLQFEQLGTATGHASEASATVDKMKQRIDEILASVPEFSTRPSFYHELDDTYFSVTSKSFIGKLYSLAGLHNIADAAAKGAVEYPQLSAEYIVDADPDLIFLADSECCGQTPEVVSKRPGWDSITAVKNDAVIDVGDDISSRWGPRIVDFFAIIVEAVREELR